MIKFSAHNLIEKNLEQPFTLKDRIRKFLMNRGNSTLRIELPAELHLILDVFSRGINNMRSDSEETFDVYALTDLLVTDFLGYIRNNPNPQKIQTVLSGMYDNEIEIHYYRETIKISPVDISQSRRISSIRYAISNVYLLELELFNQNIYEIFEEYHTVEKVIGMLLMDFAIRYKRGMAMTDVQKIIREVV